MTTLPPIDIPGTTPEDWLQLISVIQSMLPDTVDVSQLVITSNGELVNYLNGDKWVPVYTVQQVISGWANVGGANPAESTAVAIRPITDIVAVTGGTAVKDIVSGKGSFGTVKKGIILGSLMALFVSTLTPMASLDEVEEDLLFTLDPYTVDGENILVYIDENGLTHVSENIINGIREALINMGAYQNGFDPAPVPSTDTFTMPFSQVSSSESVPSNVTLLKSRYENILPYVYLTDQIYKTDYHDPTLRTVTYLKYDTDIIDIDVVLVIANTSSAGATYCDPTYIVITQTVPEYPNKNYAGYDSQGTERISSTRPYKCLDNDGNAYYVFIYGTSGQYKSTVSEYNPGLTYIIGNNPQQSSQNGVYSYINGSTGSGIPGLDVTGKSDFGNSSKTLEEIIPDLSDRYTTIANPTDDDIFNKDKWYELNLNSDDVWTDGLISDQTDPEAVTQGETDDDTKDEIIDKLLDIIRDITGTPDLPDIPAGDSGDTPPAEPPILDGSSNGLWTIYNPTKQEVKSFGAWLWSSSIIDQIVRQFNSPIDAIIGFHQIYCTPSTGSSKIIKAGCLDSPVSALEVTNQYAEINCGEVNVNEYYGNALDYDNTQVSIYLPFIGIVPLDTNIVMGSTLEVIYRIDVFTGTCLAQIKVKKQNSNAVMYAFEGNCAVQIPLTATTYTGMVGALISGISAGVSFMAGDMLHAATAGVNAAMSAMGGQTGTKQSGSMGSNAGALGIRKPYLIITRSASAMPAGFENLAGLPSTELTALTSVSGFTVVRNVHLEGIPGTAEELEEIKGLLESGVIF